MKRVVTPELLDDDAGSPAEVSSSLADLQRINRWFGGVRVLSRLVERVAARSGRRELTLLDVAGATGDVPALAREQLQKQGIRLEVTVLDRATSHLEPGNRSVVGNALALPFRDASFDLVSSSLFVHHLEPPEVRQFVNEALRVSRLAVLINDLRRHPVHLGLVYAGLPLYRSRLTRHDAPASIRRAYTPAEMRGLLGQTAAAQVDFRTYYLYRMGIIAWRNGAAA
ncbi:MAG TPA: methyltransferase domain-containing protein [Terriglobales bacterium]|nr:methyltransferase domain-containing protein [Terriglobales bacterium]